MQFVPLDYTPDLDTAWFVRPGAVSGMNGFAPTNKGSYATVGSGYFIGTSGSISGADVLHAQMFRQTGGTVRMLVFRKQNIDEYSSSATRTNQGSGYSASTTDWSVAAYGNAIIAVNYYDAPQVSTSTTFGNLAGSPPKARLVAVNAEFVMLADYDDGVDVCPDGWACSGIGNYQTWAANAATQAARNRILSEPGPIRALVAFKEGFVFFKDNSMFQADYIGPPFVWSIKRISNRVGCPAAHGVTELGGKLYWYHSSNFWSWDGANLVPVGDKVINTFNQYVGYFSGSLDGALSSAYINGASAVLSASDEGQNVVAFTATGQHDMVSRAWTFGYNTLTGKWGKWTTGSAGLSLGHSYTYRAFSFVTCTTADAYTFASKQDARLVALVSSDTATSCIYLDYPGTLPTLSFDYDAVYMSLGQFGDYGSASKIDNIWLRNLSGDQSGIYTVSYSSIPFEGAATPTSDGSGTYNSTLGAFDIRAHGSLHQFTINVNGSKEADLAGVAFPPHAAGKR